MIQIDIEMPKCCDVCMFSQWSNLSQTASCKLKDYEPCFDDFSKEYKSKRASFCPLQEVSNNSPELDKENGELISRQQAIDAIRKGYPDVINSDYKDGLRIGTDRAIYHVEQLPSAQPEPCEDTISRQAVLDAILQKPAWHNSDGSFYHSDDIKDAVNAVPPSPSRPQWIPCSERLPEEKYVLEEW